MEGKGRIDYVSERLKIPHFFEGKFKDDKKEYGMEKFSSKLFIIVLIFFDID
jgi:hypothetical protein